MKLHLPAPAALFVLALALAAPAHGATIAATTEGDSIADDGRCSLREAIVAAGTDAPVGGCPAGAGADTVEVPAGLYVLSVAGVGEQAGRTGDLDVTGGELTIAGAGAGATTVDGNEIDRVLDVAAGATVAVDGITITGGVAPTGGAGANVVAPGGTAGTGQDGGAGGAGGGIRSFGTLIVRNSAVASNRSGNGGAGGEGRGGSGFAGGGSGAPGVGGAGGRGGSGGGIFSAGPLTLAGTAVDGNASGRGGNGGPGSGGAGTGATANNTGGAGGDAVGGVAGAGGDGAGIEVQGPLTISGSTITDNVTGAGGGGGAGVAGPGGSGAGTGTGGEGGRGDGRDGGPSGSGAGIHATAKVDASATTIARNRTGGGGTGGPSLAGDGGMGGPADGNGGPGGASNAGDGGDAGCGAGVAFAGVAKLVNVTLDANQTGDGGAPGAPFPLAGVGGHGLGTGSGGAGGPSVAASGGAGGSGAAAFTTATLGGTHLTISANGTGSGVPAGIAFPGAGGKHGSGGGSDGPNGVAQPGVDGADGTAGALLVGGGGKATIAGSIFASNAPDNCAGVPVVDAGHVLQTSSGCAGAIGSTPRLAPLADNGGGLPTRALRAGSAAIDAVPASGAGCAATDARGVPRPRAGACDAGSYERTAPEASTGGADGGGSVSGRVTAFDRGAAYHFEFGTTDAYGARTPDGSAGGVAPVDVSAALPGLAPGTTYHYRLVASNGDGTTVGPDATFTTAAGSGPGSGGPADGGAGGDGVGGGGADTTAPVLRKLRARPAKFRARRGTTLRFRLSEKARVRFTVKRGRRVVARLSVKPGHAGSGKRRLRRRGLRPGRYRVTAVATDAAGNRSKPTRIRITVRR